MRLFFARNAFPLAVGAIAALFLGLFFLLPVLKVFGASVLDATGRSCTLSTYTNILSNRFYINGLANSLTIAAAAGFFTVLVGVPFAFCLARLPIGGKPGLLVLRAPARGAPCGGKAGAACARGAAAGAPVFRRSLCACAAVRALRPRDRHAAIDRH